MNITIHRDGQNFGPYTLDQVREYLASGQLQLSDLGFCDGAAEWVPLAQIPGLSLTPPPPPRTPPPPPSVRTTAPAAAPAKKGSNTAVKSCLGCFGLMVAVLVVFGAIGSIGKIGREESNSSSNPSSSTTGNSSPDQSNVPVVDASIPASQKTFTTMVDSFKEPYDNADTEIKKTNVRFGRKDALSNYFSQAGSLQFDGWAGQVQEITTESDGSAYISIKLAGTNIEIKTWNNSLSDIMSHTMIQRNDPLYQSLMNLKEGDQVSVSGTFVASDNNDHPDYIVEQSLTEEGSMKEPEFLVKFSQISKK